jgi:ubiquitin-like 1-activating enzyme E1 B
MEDMWKSRKLPEPLDYSSLLEKTADAGASLNSILEDGQKAWSLEENFTVFVDSLDRLSKRMLDMKTQNGSGPRPMITFDKDDEDTLDFVAASANIRSTIFGIDRKSKFDIKQMAGNIIPAIATTNAIVAGLCVLESFKVLRGEFDQAKEVFLTPFAFARLLASDKPRRPNPDCPVCSVFSTSVYVDLARATLNDLVEHFVRLELGYGEKEISVSNDVGILYDPDETENLTKKLSDLGQLQNLFISPTFPMLILEVGISQDSCLTIVDDDDNDPFVNVVVNVQEA